MPDSINHTNIKLIPKQDSCSTVQHYRPISLCNTVYKIISKILASRLKKFLPLMVSPFQSAFVKGPLIQENSVVAYESLHSIKKKQVKVGLLAYKADMEKAFDIMGFSFHRDISIDTLLEIPIGIFFQF